MQQKRRQSINLAIGTLETDGARITLVDTPGYADFQSDVVEALAAVDAAIVVVDASAGVEVGTEEVWRLAEERKLPRFIFVNKMDRENANYDAVLDGLKAKFGPKIAPVYLPIGSAESFRGYIDVIEQHANVYEGGKPKEVPIPDEMRAGEEARREALVEAAAEASDELMTRYLDGETISDAEIETAVHKGTREGSVVPVFVGSALKNIGVRELAAMIAKHMPSAAEVGARMTSDGKRIEPDPAAPFVAQVFKTTADPFVGRLTYFRDRRRDAPFAGPPVERDAQGRRADRQHPGPARQGAAEHAAGRAGRHRGGRQAGEHPDRRYAGRRPGAGGEPSAARSSRRRASRSASSRRARPTSTSSARRCRACSRRSRAPGSTARRAPARRS